MPSQSGSEGGRRLLVAAGTSHFDRLENLDLPLVPDELSQIAATFEALGYRPRVVPNPDHEQLEALFDDFKKHSLADDIIVAYYTSHGEKDPIFNDLYLLTRDSESGELKNTAVSPETLAMNLIINSKASLILIILDVCYAGAGAAEIIQQIGRLRRTALDIAPSILLIAAAGPKQPATPGALSAALYEVLVSDERLAGHSTEALAFEDVVGAIQEYLSNKCPSQQAQGDYLNVGKKRSHFLFPNPRYRPEIRPGLDLDTQRAINEHRVLKGGTGIGAGSWYFTGRENALLELTEWLWRESSDGKARVVTGGPGCGKSAVLARIVMQSDPEYRQELLASKRPMALDATTLPPEGVVSVAVHARRKLLADIVAQIASVLGLNARDPEELVDELNRRSIKTVIVLDALDESDEKAVIVSKLLREIVALPNVFLLVGTRPDSSEHGRRYRALGESAVEIDLDEPRYIGANDVASYVERRLLATEEPWRATPYRESPSVAQTVAQAIAERAKNVFLVAHTAVAALLTKPSIVDTSDPSWIERLPTGLE